MQLSKELIKKKKASEERRQGLKISIFSDFSYRFMES